MACSLRDVALRLVVLSVLAFLPGVARASDYGLSDIDLVDAATAGRLAALKIHTTLDLYQATKTPKGAAGVARKMKVPAGKVQEWRDFCDLLRIDGVGPKVARVLALSGVQRLSQLALAQPGPLADKIKEVNLKAEILGKLPGEEIVRSWIEQARKLAK